MISQDEIERVASGLRAATEDHVTAALKDSYVEDKLSGIEPAALLEFYNRMLDEVLGEGVGDAE